MVDAGAKCLVACLTLFLTVTSSPVTHHEYIEVAASNALNATFLDNTATIATEVVKVRVSAYLSRAF